LNRDSYLSPAFSSHGGYSSWAAKVWRQSAIALNVLDEVTFYVVGKPAAVVETAAMNFSLHIDIILISKYFRLLAVPGNSELPQSSANVQQIRSPTLASPLKHPP
jgi:hypothetical protein